MPREVRPAPFVGRPPFIVPRAEMPSEYATSARCMYGVYGEQGSGGWWNNVWNRCHSAVSRAMVTHSMMESYPEHPEHWVAATYCDEHAEAGRQGFMSMYAGYEDVEPDEPEEPYEDDETDFVDLFEQTFELFYEPVTEE